MDIWHLASTRKHETEAWNGSTWTEIADLATARGSGGSARTAGYSGTEAAFL